MAFILIVDDDLGTRETFGHIIRHQGHSVVMAESGGQALGVISEQNPDVAVVDLNLPDMTALDVIGKLRFEGTMTPCVVITGFGSIESAVRAMKLGAVDYLTKPVGEDDLSEAIDRALVGRPGHLPTIVRADGLARWALAVASVLDAPRDPKTLEDWSLIRRVAPATLREWCRTAALPPKASLDLARVLRAVWQTRGRNCPAWRLLGVADRRTLSRLLAAGGLSTVGDEAPTVGEVLDRQSLVTDRVAIEELRRVLYELNIHLNE
jgi:ActR/RegA family two-component response regulator